MPIIKSAKKRVRQARKSTALNARTKRAVKSSIKVLHTKTTEDTFKKAQSAIDVAAKKGVLHKNKAARKKRQIAKAAKAAGFKPGAKNIAKKPSPVAKKPTPKVAKNTATKPVRKSTAKK